MFIIVTSSVYLPDLEDINRPLSIM